MQLVSKKNDISIEVRVIVTKDGVKRGRYMNLVSFIQTVEV